MSRRALLLAAGAGSAAALYPVLSRAAAPRPIPLTAQDRAELDRIARYLDGIHTMTAQFQQISPDGSVETGNLWLDRPGRMRFQYNPPSPVILISDGYYVYYIDQKLEQISQIGLRSTPAWFLLRPQIRFGSNLVVTRFVRGPAVLHVTAVEKRKPSEGMLTMEFSERPLALRGWTILDQEGRTTRVYISNAQFGMALDPKLFQYKSFYGHTENAQ